MEYSGKLYGKVSGIYFPLIETTEDVEKLKKRIAELEAENEQLRLGAVSDSIFDKAVKHVQETYCDRYLNIPYMLLGDVAELIKITTGKEVDWKVLAKYSR